MLDSGAEIETKDRTAIYPSLDEGRTVVLACREPVGKTILMVCGVHEREKRTMGP
jgi:hypothetical protein